MSKLDRYLSRELAQSTFAALVVLLIVSLGGVFADVLSDIARGRVPAKLMLAQLGLQVINYLPLILPLGLMLGLMMGFGRLYRDSEMPVLTSVGIGPRRLLRPLALVVAPMLLVIGACSLWLGPWARDYSQQMIEAGQRSLLVSGLEAGRFVEFPGGSGVIYVNAMSDDGSKLGRVFVYRQDEDRMDVTTALSGALSIDGTERFLRLDEGFRVEGPLDAGLDYRLMRYASNELRLPAAEARADGDDPELQPTWALLGDARPQARAELHYRLAPVLLTLAFALLAVPLARSPPRQARYGRMMTGFLAYVLGMNFMMLGKDWVGEGRIPVALGLWWLVLPLLGFAAWMYFTDGRVVAPKWKRAK
ncbi:MULTISPECIES: LPS export ABC transporter permease LptF [Luteimonas]|uniref:Lipopolysaccharide export system permease protein LptF n=1 Tax=Luteimonas chenhongjianii TaxID=2006110 RepID=A0A290XCJ4_9GAMM|nr:MULTISPECIES: LPS export ABC transporter permease LptF [Luteimonas]ATD66884.1 LPS export ABC transporter permease LptF [Luteimonas chenhongjianii]RPD84529.1 LPS export ABC transporter permease LptF [Luteimonas sp. 100069]